MTIGDVSGDGKPDLVVANYGSRHCVDPAGERERSLRAGGHLRRRLQPACSGDRRTSTATESPISPLRTSGYGTVSILLGNGDGTFAAAVGYGTGD